MSTILLDYYHPHAGLCNQLYLITNHLDAALKQGKKIFINKFNTDIFNKNRISADRVFDLFKTNKNIHKLTGVEDLILYQKPENDFVIPQLCIYPVSSVPILASLEFSPLILNRVPKINDYFGIHFRLDMDCVIHYLWGKDAYTYFMELCEHSPIQAERFAERISRLTEVRNYCNFLLNEYIKYVHKLGFDKNYYICTSIGKNPVHNCLMEYLNELIFQISKNGSVVIRTKEYFKERELNALVELLILRRSSGLIGFEGSSYSEGYVYKVCTYLNDIKDFYFVYGIVENLPNELFDRQKCS
jgi:hypothetical protein